MEEVLKAPSSFGHSPTNCLACTISGGTTSHATPTIRPAKPSSTTVIARPRRQRFSSSQATPWLSATASKSEMAMISSANLARQSSQAATPTARAVAVTVAAVLTETCDPRDMDPEPRHRPQRMSGLTAGSGGGPTISCIHRQSKESSAWVGFCVTSPSNNGAGILLQPAKSRPGRCIGAYSHPVDRRGLNRLPCVPDREA